jgi:hypothetical protein
MARASRVPTQRTDTNTNAAEQHELKSLPHAEKLMAFAEEHAQATETPRTDNAEIQAPAPAPAPAIKRFSAVDAAREAGEQIEGLVRMKVDSVSAVSRSENGWEVIVTVVELARIPHSTDVLANYKVFLDAEGVLTSYNRDQRYTRGQTSDGM